MEIPDQPHLSQPRHPSGSCFWGRDRSAPRRWDHGGIGALAKVPTAASRNSRAPGNFASAAQSYLCPAMRPAPGSVPRTAARPARGPHPRSASCSRPLTPPAASPGRSARPRSPPASPCRGHPGSPVRRPRCASASGPRCASASAPRPCRGPRRCSSGSAAARAPARTTFLQQPLLPQPLPGPTPPPAPPLQTTPTPAPRPLLASKARPPPAPPTAPPAADEWRKREEKGLLQKVGGGEGQGEEAPRKEDPEPGSDYSTSGGRSTNRGIICSPLPSCNSGTGEFCPGTRRMELAAFSSRSPSLALRAGDIWNEVTCSR